MSFLVVAFTWCVYSEEGRNTGKRERGREGKRQGREGDRDSWVD